MKFNSLREAEATANRSTGGAKPTSDSKESNYTGDVIDVTSCLVAEETTWKAMDNSKNSRAKSY